MNEQRSLFSNLPFETNMQGDHKRGLLTRQSLRQPMPRLPIEDDSEVTHGNVISVYRICCWRFCLFRREMGSDLVTKEVEINPALTLSSHTTTKKVNIKLSG